VGKPAPWTTRWLKAAERKPVTLRLSRAQRVIGMPVTLGAVSAVLQRLGLTFSTRAWAMTRTCRDASELAL
jgi:phenylalanyl-tRNA synthetase beta chain